MSIPLTADDVVVGILHVLREENHDQRLTADREHLHKAFYNLQTQAQFGQLMSVFSFRQRETFPESPELDQALSNLDATGLISRYNQTPRYYILDCSLDVCFTAFSKTILENAGISTSNLAAAANAILRETGEFAA